jgi:hypothetical protein
MDYVWCHGDVCGDIINRFSAHHADSTTGKGVLIKLTRSAIIVLYKIQTNNILFFSGTIKNKWIASSRRLKHGRLNRTKLRR